MAIQPQVDMTKFANKDDKGDGQKIE
jgi:WD40 repeat protein